jgi:hypothetical protein
VHYPRVPSWCFVCFALVACRDVEPVHSTPPRSHEVPGADRSDSGAAPAPPDPDEAKACAVLCAVPGGIRECPAGTPCPSESARDVASDTSLEKSLCTGARPSKQ